MISKRILLLNEGNKREAAAARRPGDPILPIQAPVTTAATIRLLAGCYLHERAEVFGRVRFIIQFHAFHF